MISGKRLDLRIFLLGFLSFWANGDNYAAAPPLVRIASDLSIDIGTAALSVTSYMLFFGLCTIFFGPLGDRYGRGRILKVAAFGSAVFSMLSAFAYDLPSLIAIRAVNGGFSAGIMPLAVAYAGESATPDTRQARIGQVMGFMFLGGALATVIGGGLAYFGSWKTVYFVYGAAEFAVALPLAFLLRGKTTAAPNTGFLSSYKAVMSTASFAMVVSGALGTLINGGILARSGYILLLVLAGFAFTAAGALAAVLFRASRGLPSAFAGR